MLFRLSYRKSSRKSYRIGYPIGNPIEFPTGIPIPIGNLLGYPIIGKQYIRNPLLWKSNRISYGIPYRKSYRNPVGFPIGIGFPMDFL